MNLAAAILADATRAICDGFQLSTLPVIGQSGVQNEFGKS